MDKACPDGVKLAYILSLGVAPGYRNRGVGSRLLDHLLDYLTNGASSTAASVRGVFLHVLCDNDDAIRFYRRRHFTCHALLR